MHFHYYVKICFFLSYYKKYIVKKYLFLILNMARIMKKVQQQQSGGTLRTVSAISNAKMAIPDSQWYPERFVWLSKWHAHFLLTRNKGTVVYRALLFLHWGLFTTTLTVPLRIGQERYIDDCSFKNSSGKIYWWLFL